MVHHALVSARAVLVNVLVEMMCKFGRYVRSKPWSPGASAMASPGRKVVCVTNASPKSSYPPHSCGQARSSEFGTALRRLGAYGEMWDFQTAENAKPLTGDYCWAAIIVSSGSEEAARVQIRAPPLPPAPTPEEVAEAEQRGKKGLIQELLKSQATQ